MILPGVGASGGLCGTRRVPNSAWLVQRLAGRGARLYIGRARPAAGRIFKGVQMALARVKPFLPAEVHSNPDILGGMPCVRGTRVPAMTIVAYIRDGYSDFEIFHHYPSLPLDGVEAVRRWAQQEGVPLDRV
jgi:uncharacterized protein (DUF433 family)